MTEAAQEADMERLFEMVIITELFHDSPLSVVCLMLAERSLRTGPGSMVGSPVAEVVVVHVDEILLSSPGGRLRLRRCERVKHDMFTHRQQIHVVEECKQCVKAPDTV